MKRVTAFPSYLLFWMCWLLPSACLKGQCDENVVYNPSFEIIIPPCGDVNVLINGAFNQGCMEGWLAAWGTPSVCETTPYLTPYYACFGANNEGMFQNVTLCPGGSYVLSFAFKRINASNGEMGIYMANGLVNQPMSNSGYPSLPIDPSWQHIYTIVANTPNWTEVITAPFTIADPNNVQLLFLKLDGSNMDVAIDDVSLQLAEWQAPIVCNELGNVFSFEADTSGQPQCHLYQSVAWSIDNGPPLPGFSIEYTFPSEGTYNVCYTALDECGYENVSCIEVVYDACGCPCTADTDPPFVFNAPPAMVEVECFDDIPPVQPILAFDNCTTMPPVSFAESMTGTMCDGTLTRQYIVTDDCGNTHVVQQTVVILPDVTPPVWSGLPSPLIEITCVDPLPDLVSPQASDNCDPDVSVSFEEIIIPGVCEVEYQRIWVATDECQNSVTYTQIILQSDESAPEWISPPQDLYVTCDELDTAFPLWISENGSGSASDDCSGLFFDALYDPVSSGCDSTEVFFIVTDVCDHSSFASATLYVDAAVPLQLETPASGLSFGCGELDTAAVEQWILDHGFATSIGGCGEAEWEDDFDGGWDMDSTLITFRAIDFCGDSVTTEAWLVIAHDTFIENIQLLVCDETAAGMDTVAVTIGTCVELMITDAQLVLPDTTLIGFNTCDLGQVGSDTLVLQGIACDSVVITSFIWTGSDTTWVQSISCDTQQAGIVTTAFVNQFGCDSIVVTTTSWVSSYQTLLEVVSCQISEVGVDTVTLLSQNGCDSLVITITSLGDSYLLEFVALTCDEQQAGSDTTYWMTQFGCDSIVVMHTDFVPADTTMIDEQVCDLLLMGMDTVLLSNAQGCDSLVILNRRLVISDSVFIGLVTCDSLMVGSIIDTIPGPGCDTIHVTNQLWLPTPVTYDTILTCFANAKADTITLISSNGCDSIHIVVTPEHTLQSVYEVVNESCLGSMDGSIEITIDAGSAPPFQYQISSGAQQSEGSFQHLDAGIYAGIVTDQQGCQDTLEGIVIEQGASFVIDAGPDIEVMFGESVDLSATSQTPGIEWWWSGPGPFSCVHCASTQVGPVVANQLVTVTGSIGENCVDEDEVLITVQISDDLYIPNSFSPNDDGVNDRFFVFGRAHNQALYRMSIYDRWGNRIYAKNDLVINEASSGWDGTSRGKNAMPGVYVYVIEIHDETGPQQVLTGDVTLIR